MAKIAHACVLTLCRGDQAAARAVTGDNCNTERMPVRTPRLRSASAAPLRIAKSLPGIAIGGGHAGDHDRHQHRPGAGARHRHVGIGHRDIC